MQGDTFSFSIYQKSIFIAEGFIQIKTVGKVHYENENCIIDGHYSVRNKNIFVKFSIKSDKLNDSFEISSNWDENETNNDIIDKNSDLKITLTKKTKH